jgi:uncharacterized membrane protein
MNKFLGLFTSRKFWAAMIGLVLVMVQPLAPDLGVSAEQVVDPLMQLIGVGVIIGSYIVGTAIEDAGRSQ